MDYVDAADAYEFQSAPLTEARGDHGHRTTSCRGRPVSIRSPDRSQGRRSTPASARPEARFQSAPLTEARGDAEENEREAKRQAVSIRSPDRSQGRLRRLQVTGGTGPVSIRSPDRSQGRPKSSPGRQTGLLFQSAPLTEARGDGTGSGDPAGGRLFQSAPLTEARGDRPVRGGETGPSKFQSAPLTEARGDSPRQESRGERQGFNPLP